MRNTEDEEIMVGRIALNTRSVAPAMLNVERVVLSVVTLCNPAREY